MSLGVLDVARKRPKAKDEPASPRSRKSPDAEPRRVVFAIKGRSAWKSWVEELAVFDRLSAVDLIDRALVAYARQVGFPKPPPER